MGEDIINGPYFIRGDYNKQNGLIKFVKKYFKLYETAKDKKKVFLYVGKLYEDKMKERFVIDGTIYNPDNLNETWEFRVKVKSNSQNSLNSVEILTAPRKGRYMLSKTKQGFFGENPTNL